jgi:hypothetical protein
MSARIEIPTRKKQIEFPEPTPGKIRPGQVWETQTTHQQEKVYQILVQMCQELLRRERRDESV